CVDHILRRQPVSARDARLACRTAANLAALFEQLRPGSAMNRAVDTAAAEERGVRGVDNGVDRELGDVSVEDFESHSAECQCANPLRSVTPSGARLRTVLAPGPSLRSG